MIDNAGDELWEMPDPTEPGVAINHGAFPALLDQPEGLAFDRAGHAWVVDTAGDELWEIPDPTDPGTAINHGQFPTGLGNPGSPRGLAFDVYDHAWVVDTEGDELVGGARSD